MFRVLGHPRLSKGLHETRQRLYWGNGKSNGYRGFLKSGVPFGSPQSKDLDYSILGSILGSPYSLNPKP